MQVRIKSKIILIDFLNERWRHKLLGGCGGHAPFQGGGQWRITSSKDWYRRPGQWQVLFSPDDSLADQWIISSLNFNLEKLISCKYYWKYIILLWQICLISVKWCKPVWICIWICIFQTFLFNGIYMAMFDNIFVFSYTFWRLHTVILLYFVPFHIDIFHTRVSLKLWSGNS